MATHHYPIGGSSFELAEQCPASVKERLAQGDRKGGPLAEKGNRIHSYIELIWTQQYAGRKLSKDEKDLIKTLTEDERKTGIALVEALKGIATKHGFDPASVKLEQQLSFLGTFAGGTYDAGMWKAFGSIIVVDFKTGYNQIEAEENIQGIFYLCTLIRNLSKMMLATVTDAWFYIAQPDEAGLIVVKGWNVSIEKLAEYDGRIALVVQRAKENPDLYVPGDHCKDMWCKVAATCKAHEDYRNTKTQGRLALIKQGGKFMPTNDGAKLAEELDALPHLEAMASAIKKYKDELQAHARAIMEKTPDAVPRYKLVDSLGNRTWSTPEKDLVKKLKETGLKTDDIYERSMLGPAPIERLFKVKKADLLAKVKSDLTDPAVAEAAVTALAALEAFEVDAHTDRKVNGKTIVAGQAETIEAKLAAKGLVPPAPIQKKSLLAAAV